MMSEKIELLGTYANIPKELTIKAIPTSSELDYVGSENFEQTMLDKIFPQAIEEKINPYELLEIDFQWICRCLRFINYGPYHTVNTIFCDSCGAVRQEVRVDLRTVAVKPLPEGFTNDIVIKKEDLIDYKKDIHLSLLTIKDTLNAYSDKLFFGTDGKPRKELARMCYMIKQIGKETNITPVQAKMMIENELSTADYAVLKEIVNEITDYGLRAGGRCQCPRCKSDKAAFIALVDDRFFRPTVGDIRTGRDDRRQWPAEIISASETTDV